MNKANLDLGRLIGEFKLTCEVEGKSIRTIEWYFSFLRQFEEYLRRSGLATYVNEIDKGYIRQYISFLQRDGEAGNRGRRLAPATVQGHVRTLKAFFAWLLREGYVKTNVMSKIPVPKAPAKVVDTLGCEALTRMIRCYSSPDGNGLRDLLIMFLLLDTGIRLSELVGIKLPEVDLEEGYIKISRGKGGRERWVPIGSIVRKYLLKYIRSGRPEPATGLVANLVLTRQGMPLKKNGVQQMLRRWGRRAEINGVRVSPHTFRHTFARNYLINGGDIFSLQKILGHSSLASVRLYLNLFSVDLKEQHRKFSPVDHMASNRSFLPPGGLKFNGK